MTPQNISIVEVWRHNLWHTMFSNLTPEQICTEINHVWLDPNFRFDVVRLDKPLPKSLERYINNPLYHFEDGPEPDSTLDNTEGRV